MDNWKIFRGTVIFVEKLEENMQVLDKITSRTIREVTCVSEVLPRKLKARDPVVKHFGEISKLKL